MLAAAQESIFSVLKSLAHLLFPLLSQRTQKSKDINAMISGKLDSVLNKFEIRGMVLLSLFLQIVLIALGNRSITAKTTRVVF